MLKVRILALLSVLALLLTLPAVASADFIQVSLVNNADHVVVLTDSNDVQVSLGSAMGPGGGDIVSISGTVDQNLFRIGRLEDHDGAYPRLEFQTEAIGFVAAIDRDVGGTFQATTLNNVLANQVQQSGISYAISSNGAGVNPGLTNFGLGHSMSVAYLGNTFA